MKLGRILFLLLAMTLGSWAWAAPVNINTADAKTIAKMVKGIGDKKAQAIVAYREQNGPFVSVDDLLKIKGIGQKTVDKNRENLTVGEPEEEQSKQ